MLPRASNILADSELGSEHDSEEDVFAWNPADSHHAHYDEDATWFEGQANGDDYDGEVEDDLDAEDGPVGVDSDFEADYPRL
ncbi:hypothetical protein NUW54_g12686 [Trametes sanguinea]|uniref:Uncharacterized protein n=1 Tax=Trametes sanguinea TaxID=158606 RepID=A0ACC1MVU1_9APHY|nr:hypothetical protein NUW54_g12686 [Trametes sanguinea]